MNRRAGYSLFEVLLAFAVMSLVLAALLPRQAQLFGRVALIDERQLAQDYALSRLDRLGMSDPMVPGVATEAYRDWRIKLDLREVWAPNLPETPLLAIAVSVETATGTPLAQVETTRAAP